MTEEKAEYFASIPEFSLMFSIDGDEKTHNEHRKLEMVEDPLNCL